jgi:hypothetical protein
LDERGFILHGAAFGLILLPFVDKIDSNHNMGVNEANATIYFPTQ